MSGIDADRPQDVGRRHKRRGKTRETRGPVLGAYEFLMRKELRNLLLALELDPLTLAERERTWKLAITLAKELGAAIEEPRQLHPPSRAVDDAPAAANF